MSFFSKEKSTAHTDQPSYIFTNLMKSGMTCHRREPQLHVGSTYIVLCVDVMRSDW